MTTTAKVSVYGVRGETNAKAKFFDEKASEVQTAMKANPFSKGYEGSAPPRLSKGDPNYGKPVAGSKSEKRGLKAAAHINAEVGLLCEMIHMEGTQFEDGTAAILFKDLFQIYTVISNKVVGTLLRARKHGFVEFEGETLFQGRDDKVPIYLLKPIQRIKEELAEDREFVVGVCHRSN